MDTSLINCSFVFGIVAAKKKENVAVEQTFQRKNPT